MMDDASPGHRLDRERESPTLLEGEPISPTPVRAAPARPRRRSGRILLLVLLLAAAAGVGYRVWLVGHAKPTAAQGRRGGGDGPQVVGIAGVTKGEMPVVLSGLGTVTPLATVTVRSQISGYLTQIGFREGQTVRKDDFLAQIDPRPYEALLAQYQGQLRRDQALLQNARLDLTRYQTLNRQDSISKQNVDTQASVVAQYEGVVAADQAQVDQQRLNIAYCRITTPVEGRVGLRQVDQGNYITAASTTIVVVTQLHPISVLFTLPETQAGRVMARLRAGATLAVTATDRSDTDVLATGKLETVDNQIDTTTGTVRLRALFDNADERLFPNQFVNAKLTVDTVRDATLVPTVAIQRGQPGTFVYLMDGDEKVSVRPITLAETDGANSVVTKGLAPGDRVVVDGADRLRDGMAVRLAGASPPAGEPRGGHGGRRPRGDAAANTQAPPAPGTVQGASQSPGAPAPAAANRDAPQGAPTDRPQGRGERRRDGQARDARP